MDTTETPPPAAPPTEVPLHQKIKEKRAGDKAPRSEDKDQLERLGVNKAMAMRILASADDSKWMHLKVTTRVNMTFLVNSLHQMGRVQLAMRKLSTAKDTTARDRVNAASVVAQMGQAIARTSEANLSNAARLDDPDRDADKQLPPTNNAYFGFPPVAQKQVPAATTGDATDVEVVPAVKSP